MDAKLLNKLSREKQRWIDHLILQSSDDFELAANVQVVLNQIFKPGELKVKVARGPKHLKVLLKNSTALRSAGKIFDQLAEFRQQKASECLNSFNYNIQKQEADELRKMIFWDLNFQLSQAIFSQISHSTLMLSLEKEFQNLSRELFSFEDADWLGFYAIVNECLNPKQSICSDGLNFIKHGGFLIYIIGNECIIFKKPAKIERNQNLVLHSEKGPAVEWEDGSGIFFWNGIEVSQKLIQSPDLITKEDILSEMNVERRRCMQEALGSERFANLLGLEPIDQKEDKFGNLMILYRTAERDHLIGEHIHFAKVICPTTGRNYFLCVPPSITNVDEAVAWTFGKNLSEYNPQQET